MRILSLLVGGVLLAAVPASAATPAALPTVTKTLTAGKAVKRSCASVTKAGKPGLAAARYTSPMSGYVTARLSGARTSDWDLVAVDRATGTPMAASQAFRSNEVVQAWTTAQQGVDFIGCRRKGAAKSAKLAITFYDVSPAPYAPASLVRVYAANEKLDALDAAGLDVTESRGIGWADVIVSGADQLALIEKAGLRHTVRVANLDAATTRSSRAALRAAGPSVPSGRTEYRVYDDIQAELKKLVEDHPDAVRPLTIGKTFQGRDIQGVEIAKDVKADDGRPVFFLMGVHHAREWPAAETAMEYAHLLAQGGDLRVEKLLAAERTAIVPVVNVDGYISSRNAAPVSPYDNILAGRDEEFNEVSPLTADTAEAVAPPGGVGAYRRKNCDGAVPDGAFPCELQWGVDNNRNYGNLWGGPGASQDVTSQSFHGPSPRSEPETQAVWNFARTHQVTGLITLHTIAALVLRPPGIHDAGLSPDEAAMKDLGDKMAAATGYTSQYGFQLYDTAGTTEDDTYAATGGYGYTIEIGPAGGTFHGDYAKYVIEQWNKGDVKGTTGMREALLLMGESVADTKQHAVIRGSAPAGAKLEVSRSFDTLTSSYCEMGVEPLLTVATLPDPVACPGGVKDPQTLKDSLKTSTVVPASGKFEWHVNQSTRPFVGGGAVIRELSKTPSREVTFTGSPASPPSPSAPTVPDPSVIDPTDPGTIPVPDGPGTYSEDHPYTIGPDERPTSVRIDVTWDTPEDYDLEVYRKNADGTLTQIGSSGENPGTPEQVTLSGDQVTPGTYVVRVVYFAAASGTWTAKVGLYQTKEIVTTGHPEAYTLTCSVSGIEKASRQVFIARGQSLDLDPCTNAAPAVVHPDSQGNPVAGPPPTSGSSGTPVTPATPAVTKAQVKKAKKACTSAKKAVKGKKGKKKAKAKKRAKTACRKAARLAKEYAQRS